MSVLYTIIRMEDIFAEPVEEAAAPGSETFSTDPRHYLRGDFHV